jgi:hypothetical protein
MPKTFLELVHNALEAIGFHIPAKAFIDPFNPMNPRPGYELRGGICPKSKLIAGPKCRPAI